MTLTLLSTLGSLVHDLVVPFSVLWEDDLVDDLLHAIGSPVANLTTTEMRGTPNLDIVFSLLDERHDALVRHRAGQWI